MAILDGKHVENGVIDPAKHKYIGQFRYPSHPVVRSDIVCPCGEIMRCVGQPFNHWQMGHFDEPQYVTISGIS